MKWYNCGMAEGLETGVTPEMVSWKKPPIPEKEKPLNIKEKAFYVELDSFPQPTQDLIASLSTSFLEADVYNQFKESKGSISSLRKRLIKQGLMQEQVELVLDFFHLPYGKPKTKDESR